MDSKPSELNRSELARELRENTRTKSLQELAKRGASRVRVISTDDVVRVVDRILTKLLTKGGIVLQPTVREEIIDSAREEMKALRKEHKKLQSMHAEERERHAQAQVQVEELRDGIRSTRDELLAARQRQREETPVRVVSEAMRRRVRLILEGSLAPRPTAGDSMATPNADGAVAPVELAAQLTTVPVASTAKGLDQLTEKILACTAQMQFAPVATPAADETVILEKRLTKLRNRLEQAETNLRDVLEGKEMDHGVASVYRNIQGLTDHDANFKKKKGLLTEIYVANKRLLQEA